KSGASFGLMNGMGSAGRLYEPGKIHRSDRMAAQGIYDDGKRGIRRMTDPERFAGLACIPNHDIDAAVGEIERVARRGGMRGLEISRRGDMTPLWDPWWNPLWDAVAASGLPVHFHTIGSGVRRDFTKLA